MADLLVAYRGTLAVVLALPRGGVPVADEVAKRLQLPLDILVVRKLGAPDNAEVGMGAVAEGGARYVDASIVSAVGATNEQLARTILREEREIERRVARWRGSVPPLPLDGRVAIVIDDGLATGGTVRAALPALRKRRPRAIVLAVPVAPASTLAALREECDDVVCVDAVESLGTVSDWYEDFTQVRDERVSQLLARARAERADPGPLDRPV